jgi:hypothetical protein
MSTIFENFTVSEVNFVEPIGTDLSSTGSYSLTITPDEGFTLDANNFALIQPIPSGITNVVFTQTQESIELTFEFAAGTIVPGNDSEFPLCIRGFADGNAFTINGIYHIQTTNATPADETNTYANSGAFESSEVVLSKTIAANTNYYFQSAPIASVTQGNADRYNIQSSDTLNNEGRLISRNFNITYTYPNENISGDEITIVGNAIPIITKAQYINAYTLAGVTGATQPNVPPSGDTRVLRLIGDPGSAWNVEMQDTLGAVVQQSVSGIIDSTGIAEVTMIFPSTASPVTPPFIIIISGDINPNIANVGNDVQVVVPQTQSLTIQFIPITSNSNIVVSSPAVVNLVPNYTYPNGDGVFNITLTAELNAVGGVLNIISNPNASDWTPVIPDPSATEMIYSISGISTLINSSGQWELNATVTVSETGTTSFTHTLDIDSFVSGLYGVELGYDTANGQVACCTTKTTYYLDQPTLASSSTIYADAAGSTFAPLGYYSE